MNEIERNKMLMINDSFLVNGQMVNTVILHNIYMYKDHSRMFSWLLNNKITGKRLYEWWALGHKGSFLSLVTEIIRRVNKEMENKPILRNQLAD